MAKFAVIVLICLFTSLSHAKVELLGRDQYLESDLKEYGKLDGTVWYKIDNTPQIKKVKIKLESVPDSPYDEPMFQVSDSSNVHIFIRGIKLKEGPLKELNIPEADPNVKNNEGVCTYFSRPLAKPEPNKEFPIKPLNYELVIKCGAKTASSLHYLNEEGALPPRVSWAWDLNHDGYPDFLVYSNPWEKGSSYHFFMSEMKDGELKYKNIGMLLRPGC